MTRSGTSSLAPRRSCAWWRIERSSAYVSRIIIYICTFNVSLLRTLWFHYTYTYAFFDVFPQLIINNFNLLGCLRPFSSCFSFSPPQFSSRIIFLNYILLSNPARSSLTHVSLLWPQANVGDSRAVASVCGHAQPLSYDHKPSNEHETERILAAGGWIEFNRVNGTFVVYFLTVSVRVRPALSVRRVHASRVLLCGSRCHELLLFFNVPGPTPRLDPSSFSSLLILLILILLPFSPSSNAIFSEGCDSATWRRSSSHNSSISSSFCT